MPELIAKPALPNAPLTLAGCTLSLFDVGAISSIAIYPGQHKAVAKALKPLGLAFPAPNSSSQKAGVTLAWTAQDQAFLIGAEAPDMGAAAAVTDQSGGWAVLALQGARADQILARYMPNDLRLSALPVGASVRAPLNHMQSVLIRQSETGFQVLVFRSMARTAWHEIEIAMRAVAARAA